MRRTLDVIHMGVIALLIMPALASAQQSQDAVIKRGAAVFAASCTGYCHGANGTAGTGAPALAGRGLDADFIEKAVMYGVPGTAMVEWGQRIPKPDSAAVIAYVESLNGILGSPDAAALRNLTPEAQRGSALFFEARDTSRDVRLAIRSTGRAYRSLARFQIFLRMFKRCEI